MTKPSKTISNIYGIGFQRTDSTNCIIFPYSKHYYNRIGLFGDCGPLNVVNLQYNCCQLFIDTEISLCSNMSNRLPVDA